MTDKSIEREKHLGKIEIAKSGGHIIRLPSVVLFENTDDDDANFLHVVVDCKPSGALIEYPFIPDLIKFLETVYQTRIVEGRLETNHCESCGRPLSHD